MKTKIKPLLIVVLVFHLLAEGINAQPDMENLDRGIVAVQMGGDSVYVGWRMLKTDSDSIAFNLYRSTAGATAIKLNDSLITESTNWVDTEVDQNSDNAYFVKAIEDGIESQAEDTFVLQANSPERQYRTIQLEEIEPAPDRFTFVQEGGIADLDGDGDYDFVIKRTFWSGSGIVDETIKLEAYTNEGDFMWRVDLGPNLQPDGSGNKSCYVVYDFDGDGKAEVAAKTSEGTTFGDGFTIGDTDDDGKTDYRDPAFADTEHLVRTGPEFLSIIDGETGAEKARSNWIARGSCSDWGDDRCYRAGSNHMAVGFMEGDNTASIIVARGIYALMKVETWDFDGSELSMRWDWSNEGLGSQYYGQGFHNRRVGDVDGDSKDEFLHGAIAFDDDGSVMYADGLGHGDRIHLTDIDPDRPGLEVFTVRECPSCYQYDYGLELHDAATGEILFGSPEPLNGDVGRGLVADIDPRYRGLECFAAGGGAKWLLDSKGRVITDDNTMPPVNFAIWWDGDMLRETMDGLNIFKWDYQESNSEVIFTMDGTVSMARGAPVAYGDIYGDWREEVIMPTEDHNELRIYTTITPTDIRIPTFMQDPTYRMSVVSLTSGYLQATQTGFYTGVDMFLPDSLVPPSIPYNFQAKSHNDSVKLSWDENLESDMAGYDVYRSVSDTNNFIKINEELLTDTSILDDEVVNDSIYYYYLVCMDVDSNKSVRSEMIIGNPTNRPPYPGDFTLNHSRDTVMASWSLIEDRDVDGYNIYRSDEKAGAYDKRNTELIDANTTKFKDIVPKSGEYFYYITSVENDTLESFNSNILGVAVGPRNVLQAENASLSGTSVDANHSGYHGSGFANFGATGTVTFYNVDGRNGGEHLLLVRYGLGNSERIGTLAINGETQSFTMQGTGAWTNYIYDTLRIELNEGTDNTISFASTGGDYGNLDEIVLVALNAEFDPITTETEVYLPENDDNELLQNYPNPFFDVTHIRFKVKKEGHVKIDIINNMGQRINLLSNSRFSTGIHEITWKGTNSNNQNIPKGLYYCRFISDYGTTQVRKLIYSEGKSN